MRAFLPLALALATPVQAHSLEVFGYAGDLGEWEVTANLTEQVALGSGEFSGPVTLRHTGVCSLLGPEEKTGEVRLRQSESRVEATLLVDGAACSYSGKLGHFYSGTMNCPGRPATPLKLWLK
jgi:hypothetical protein